MSAHPAAIRPARLSDAAALGALFRSAVLAPGPSRYTAAQVEAWAASADDPEAFGLRMLAGEVLLAEESSGPVGFAALGEGGYLRALYVRGDRQGRGVGRVLLAAVVQRARERGDARVWAEANAFSLPLLTGAGFVVVGEETVVRGGVSFRRHIAELTLTGGE